MRSPSRQFHARFVHNNMHSHPQQIFDHRFCHICLQMEAEALLDLLQEEYPNVKFWISLQCQDDNKLAHGENFAETARKLWNKSKGQANHKNLVAIGVNCLHPKNVAPLFKSLNGLVAVEHRIPLIVYPNSGEVYTVETG